MKFRSILSVLLLLVYVAGAQVDSLKPDKKYLKSYWTDSRDLVKAPFNWIGRQWLNFGIFAGTTVAITAIDQPINDFFNDHQTKELSDISKYALEPLGNYYAYGVMAGFLAHGLLADNSKSVSTGLLAIESYILSGLLVRIPKYAFGRTRPDAWWEPGPNEWKGPIHGKSFPSGHTTSAFAVATVIAYQYKDTPWVPVTAYSLATLAGVSRLYDNRHWLSDVFAGAVIGTVTARFICTQHEKKQISLEPIAYSGISGIKLVYKW